MEGGAAASVDVGGGGSNEGGDVNKRMALNDTKAGMEGLDVDRINQIIMEASKGSKFYSYQQKAQEKLNLKIESIRHSFQNLTAAQIDKSTAQMDVLARKLEEHRDLSRTIVHVDMDAFFAAVEMRDNPELRDKPMAVGGMSMLSTSNYLARRFGVRAAMPGFMGKKLCPQLIIVPCNYEKYTKVSEQVQDIFKDYDPHFSSVSLDEANLDITDYLLNANALASESQALTPQQVTDEIRQKIFLKTGLTASAGIASNSLLAKICGDVNKPNGQFYLEPSLEAIREFINKLPIRKVGGIGNVTEQMLNALDIFTCKDLWDNRGIINLLLKSSTSSFLLQVSMGVGSWSFSVDEPRKSISSERTFYGGRDRVGGILREICNELERDLAGRKVRSVTLKLKTADFQVKTRNVNLLNSTNDADIIFETAWGIYNSYLLDNLSIRLIGVRLSNFDDPEDGGGGLKQKRIDQLLMKPVEDKHQCPICMAKFKFYKQLDDHVQQCLSQQQSPCSSSRNEPEESFLGATSKCPTCCKTFGSKTEIEIRQYFDHMDLCQPNETTSPPRKKQKTKITDFMTITNK